MRLLVGLALTALFAAGCGASDEPEAAANDPAGTSADSAVDDDNDGTGAGTAAWDEAVAAAWDEFQVVRTRAAIRTIAALETGEHRLDWTQALLVEEGEGITALLAGFPAAPDDAALAEPSTQLQAVLEEMQAAGQEAWEIGESDPEAVRTSLDQVGDDLPAAPYGQAYVAYSDMDPTLSEACFSLQEAMTAAGLALLDCTGSNVDTEAIEAELAASGAQDPAAEPTGLATEWEDGVHEISVFDPAFTLDLNRPVLVTTTADSVEITDPDDEDLSFLITPTTHVVDPTALDPDPGLAGSMPLPGDLGPWLAELPVEIVEEGTITVGAGEARFWRLSGNPELMMEAVGEPGLLILGGYAGEFDPDMVNVGVIPVLPIPDATTVLVDWRRGDDRLLVHTVEEGGDVLPFVTEVMATAS